MALIVNKLPDVHVSPSELARLQDEYSKAFMFYAGTPPDCEEWAIGKIQGANKYRAAGLRASLPEHLQAAYAGIGDRGAHGAGAEGVQRDRHRLGTGEPPATGAKAEHNDEEDEVTHAGIMNAPA